MHRTVSFLVATGITLLAASASAGQQFGFSRGQATVPQGAAGQPGSTSITGTAVNPAGEPLSNVVVQARDLVTGQVAGSTTPTTAGQFSIVGLNPGPYVIEIVDRAGQIVGTSAFVSLAAGTAVTSATVIASTGALASAAASSTALASTALGAVRAAAAAGGVAGIVVPPTLTQASPSR